MADYGIREWYNPTDEAQEKARSLTWGRILEHWPLLEGDLHRLLNIDLGDGILHRRSWRWFETRVTYILGMDSQLARQLGVFEPTPNPLLL